MCGIFAMQGTEVNLEKIYQGLKKLEYRGYDSSGIVIHNRSEFRDFRSIGSVDNLKNELVDFNGTIGLGHVRWASHGRVSLENSHPIINEYVSVIHNGIIENFRELSSQFLNNDNIKIDCDTSVLNLMLKHKLEQGFSCREAFLSLAQSIKGQNAVCVIFHKQPDQLYFYRSGLPLVFSKFDQGIIVTSDCFSLPEYVENYCDLPDQCVGILNNKEVEVISTTEDKIPEIKSELYIHEKLEDVDSSYYSYEIFQQPQVLEKLIQRYVDESKSQINSSLCGISGLNLGKVDRIVLTGCGSAYHGALIAKCFIEQYTNIPIIVEVANELGYRKNLLTSKTLLLVFSQSGETADVLALMPYVHQQKIQSVVFTNRSNSKLAKLASKTIDLKCGFEISVASTKALTSMILCSYLFALDFARSRGQLKKDVLKEEIELLKNIPLLVESIISNHSQLDSFIPILVKSKHLHLIGRWIHGVVAQEAALKIKELSYIPCSAYPAGELKHGSLALIDEESIVLAFVSQDCTYEKTLSNICEVEARGGRVFVIGGLDHELVESKSLFEINSQNILDAVLCETIVSQLISLKIAETLGRDVDKPRNLAKSITVE